MINIGMTKYNLSNESTAFYRKIMEAHSAEEHECDYEMFEPDPNSYKFAKAAKYHLPNFQNFSKYRPIIPHLIFKASLFSLSPPTTNPSTLSTRERGRERESATAEMRGAFKSGVP